MQVTLSQSHVRRLARGFVKIVPGRGSVLPVLDQVRFRRLGERDAEATVSNLDETLSLLLPGAVTPDSGPGAFLCPFAELRNLAKDLGAGDAVLLQSLPGESPRLGIIAQIAGRDIRSRLETTHPNEFPGAGSAAPMTAADVGAFLHAYRSALPFVSADPSRSPLGGVFWHEEKHSLVATDGRRLTLFHLSQLTLGRDLIIPFSKVLANAILDAGEGALGIALEGERACLEIACGPWRYRVRGIDALYPNYSVVIPADAGQFVAAVDIAPQDLCLLRSAVSRFTKDHSVAICLCALPAAAPFLAGLTPEADGSFPQVQLANSRCTGEAPCAQAVNGQYLIDCLEAGFLHLRLPTDGSPWLCTGERSGVHCLMPMREDTTSIAASVAQSLNPEGNQTMAPEVQTAPAPATAESVATPESTPAAPPATPPEDGTAATAGLSLVPPDPLQDLRSAVSEADDALRQATVTVRSLREKARAVERSMRDREKLYAKSEKVLDQLKLVAGF